MWHNDVSYMNVQKFCPHSPRRPFAVLLFRPLRGRGVGFLSLLGLWGALGTCHICCIRRGQSSLGVSALLLCRRGFDARAAWFSNGISFCLLHSVIFVDLSNMTIFWEIWILAITWMKQMLPFRFVWVLRTIWNLYGFICATLYLVTSILYLIQQLQVQSFDVRLIWLPSHINISENKWP